MKWRRDDTAGGVVVALVRARTGPKGLIKLTPALAYRIAALEAAGETLAQIAAAMGVSTATVRVALGRVRPVKRGRRVKGATRPCVMSCGHL